MFRKPRKRGPAIIVRCVSPNFTLDKQRAPPPARVSGDTCACELGTSVNKKIYRSVTPGIGSPIDFPAIVVTGKSIRWMESEEILPSGQKSGEIRPTQRRIARRLHVNCDPFCGQGEGGGANGLERRCDYRFLTRQSPECNYGARYNQPQPGLTRI